MQASLYIKYPEFLPLQVLKSEDLISLRDGIHGIISSMYMDYSEGIIKGFVPYIEKNEIIITKGVAKQNNIIFWCDKDFKVDIPVEEGNYYMYLQIEKTNIQIICKIYITMNKSDDIEVCRFSIREGAILYNYDQYIFKNDAVKYNTINLEYADISNRFQTKIIHYKILEKWIERINPIKIEKVDMDFINILLYSNFRVHPLTIYAYIYEKTNVRVDNNYEAINELSNIVKDIDEIKNTEYFE